MARLLVGLGANEAEAQLLHVRRRAAQPLLKLLRSAVAGAKATKRLEAETLYIQNIRVDQGPMLKRALPRARGMATPIQKKTSHVTVVLDERTGAVPRFKIVVPKKVKLPPESKAKQKKPKAERAPKDAGRERAQKGFWRKMFRRKSV